MVATRRSSANSAAANGTSRSKSITSVGDTIHVLVPRNSKPENYPSTPKPPGETPPKSTMNTPKQSPSRSGEAPSSALRRSAPKPTSATDGGALNPIIVSDSSPSQPTRPPQRNQRQQQQQLEPHKFLDKGYRKLYSYRPSRPVLAPKPANGSTFTGHQSHDLYRMMNAKMAATSAWNSNGGHGYTGQNVPFEVQYPMMAQYLARQHGAASHIPTPYTQYYDHRAPVGGYPMVPFQNEDMIRKKAVQYIREYSRPSARKRRLSDADPDETSASESEQPIVVARTSPLKSTPHLSLTSPSSPAAVTDLRTSGKLTIFHDQDPNLHITQLTKHTTLLTSLLQIYPHSADQKGLREDIAMLVSVQNQRVAEWMKSETRIFRKRRKSNTDSAISVSSDVTGRGIEATVQSAIAAQEQLEQEKRMEQDNKMRQFLSASADMWQDGSGQSVADIFAASPGSSPIASLREQMAIPEAEDSSCGNKILDDGIVPGCKVPSLDGEVTVLDRNTSNLNAQLWSDDGKVPNLNPETLSYDSKISTPISNGLLLSDDGEALSPLGEASNPPPVVALKNEE